MEGVAKVATDKLNMEILPFIRTYKSGRIDRLSPAKLVPPSVDPRTGVSSRDIIINPAARLSARLYLPPTAVISQSPPNKKLPVIVYYHGGGFCAFSAASSPYHSYLNSLVAEGEVVAVSVDYRLAPEHPLPAAYEDSWETLLWVAEHAYGSRGLDGRLAECGDFSKIFLAGDSAGANIVHNMGIRLGENGMEVEGLALVHPYFWGKERNSSRKKGTPSPSALKADDFDALWPFVCPGTVGLDDPRLNPTAAGAPCLTGLGSRRVLVSVAERDLFREKGIEYYERLWASGWGRAAMFYETKGKDHVFHIFRRSDEASAELMRCLIGFFKDESVHGRYSLLMGSMGITHPIGQYHEDCASTA